MKCPSCQYENTTPLLWNDTSEHGPFYELELTLKRAYTDENGYKEANAKTLMGCPACNSVFMGD